MRPYRVLVGKIGLDGHDRGAKVIATSLRDSGMEVIYTGIRQSPENVVNIAIQEDVDVIGLSVLSGAHITIFRRLKELLDKNDIHDILIIGGGIIPEKDIEELKKTGVKKIFLPGSRTKDIANFIKEEVLKLRNF